VSGPGEHLLDARAYLTAKKPFAGILRRDYEFLVVSPRQEAAARSFIETLNGTRKETMTPAEREKVAIDDAVEYAVIDGTKVRVNYNRTANPGGYRYGGCVSAAWDILRARGVFDSFYKMKWGYGPEQKSITFANGGRIDFRFHDDPKDETHTVTLDAEEKPNSGFLKIDFGTTSNKAAASPASFPRPWSKERNGIQYGYGYQVKAANGSLVADTPSAAAADAIIEASKKNGEFKFPSS
jgi:hypothetical protein